jgi:hypothetical protein
MTKLPDRCWRSWRRAGLLPVFERLDHDHMSTAAWTWRADIDWLDCVSMVWWWRDVEQRAGKCDIGLARGTGEDAVMPDTVKATWQDVSQEPADKRVCC